MKHILIFAAILLSACATNPDARYGDATRSSERNALSPRDLTSGECGLFVWRNISAKPFILFSGAESAIWTDREVAYTPDTPAAPEQSFTADGRDWTLSLSDPVSTPSGLRYDAGILSTARADGWQTRIPVVGLSTCPESDWTNSD